MRSRCVATLLLLGLFAGGHGSAGEPDPDSLQADERALEAAKLGTDGPALLKFLRKQILVEADQERIALLVKQLGDDAFNVREKASAELAALGPRAIPLLRPALKDRDPEVARRAAECLRHLEDGGNDIAAGGDLVSAAVRLVAVRKPAGAAEVLLDCLLLADHEPMIAEIETALVAVAVREGKVEPILTKALRAAEPLRRGVSGAALARAAVAEQRNAVRKLLRDPDPGVRLRIGLALAASKDKQSVPVLIELLGELPQEQVWPVETLLHRLAGDRAPALSPGSDPASIRKYRDAWAAWWRDNEAAIEMPAHQDNRHLLGYTLIVIADYGQVVELDRDGKVRWQFGGLSAPFDAQLLPGGRVLVAESGCGVSERNLKGELLWQKPIANTLQCQRLAGGKTFVVTHKALVEIDADGKERSLYTHNELESSLVAAKKMPSGQIIAMDSNGTCMTLNAAGTELRRFTVGKVSNNCLEVLPDGHILIAKLLDDKVIECDSRGRRVWEIEFRSAFSAHRLPNGNTLIACREPARVVEVNRAGKVVWEHACETANHRPWFVTRR
jgi:hypothetical protein